MQKSSDQKEHADPFRPLTELDKLARALFTGGGGGGGPKDECQGRITGGGEEDGLLLTERSWSAKSR
jgi:hypothetical protein